MKKCESYSDKELLEEHLEGLKGRLKEHEDMLATAKDKSCKSKRLFGLTNDQSVKINADMNKIEVERCERVIADIQKSLSKTNKSLFEIK